MDYMWVIVLIAGALAIALSYKLVRRLRTSLVFEYPLAFLTSRREDVSRKRLLLKVIVLALLLAVVLSPTITVKRRVTINSTEKVNFRVNLGRPAVVLVVDVSGSMGERIPGGVKIEAAKKALRKFLDELNESIDVGLITFSGSVVDQVPITSNRSAVLRVVERMKPIGGTMYTYPLMTALSWLRPYRYLNLSCAVIFVTDGYPADPGYRDLLSDFRRDKIPIYVLYIGPGGDRGEMEAKYMANQTKGKEYTVNSVSAMVSRLSKLSKSLSKTLTQKISFRTSYYVEKRISLSDYLVPFLIIASFVLWTLTLREERTFF